MTARQQRRREEHKARKEAYKAQKQVENRIATGGALRAEPVSAPLLSLAEMSFGKCEPTPRDEFSPEFIAYARATGDRIARRAGFDPKTGRRAAPTTAPEQTPEPAAAPSPRAEQNRANAQHSTGPKTLEGRAVSSQNAIRHGLASNTFVVLEWENYDDFSDLLANLRAEHQPATQTEALLVEKMAEHFWLSQRALRLQDMCFRMDMPLCEQPKELALYIRYGTTHDRAFHKCLSDLLKLRAEQRKVESGFVSQKHKQAAEIRKQELHEAKLRVVHATKVSREPAIATQVTAEMILGQQPLSPISDNSTAKISVRAA